MNEYRPKLPDKPITKDEAVALGRRLAPVFKAWVEALDDTSPSSEASSNGGTTNGNRP